MDNQSAAVDFALIGHQDSWKKITEFVGYLNEGKQALTAEKIAEVYSYIPARKVFDLTVNSITGNVVKGIYVETFISPDDLGAAYLQKNVVKVIEAAKCARKFGCGIAGLGGFTSIVLEGGDNCLNENSATKFTTGNTLTTAFIVKGIEKACRHFNKELANQNILIIGATGDIGSACVKYFRGKANKLLLSARQEGPLQSMTGKIKAEGDFVEASTDLKSLLPQADIIVAIASSTIENLHPALCKKDVIICDAGYPKNVIRHIGDVFADRLFWGGMGYVKNNFSFTPAIYHEVFDFTKKNMAHGCMLEAVVLAFENNFSPYSTGKGNITVEKIEWIYETAKKHGITEAPFFNSTGLWNLKNKHEKTDQWAGAVI